MEEKSTGLAKLPLILGVNTLVIVCDLSDININSAIEDYVPQLSKQPYFNKATPIVLVGTKQDRLLEDAEKKAVAKNANVEEAKQVALENAKQKLAELQEKLNQQGYVCTDYHITSAKTGEGVQEVFTAVATNLLKEKLNAEQGVKPRESTYVNSNPEQTAKPKKAGLGLWDHFKRHPTRYILGLLLAAAIAIVLTVPVIGQAAGLAGAIGFLVANTAWQLGLLAAGAALLGFVACMLGGKLIDKIKRSRLHKPERLLEQENKRGNEQHIDAASASTQAPDILADAIHPNPVGVGAGKTAVQPHQSGSASVPTASSSKS